MVVGTRQTFAESIEVDERKRGQIQERLLRILPLASARLRRVPYRVSKHIKAITGMLWLLYYLAFHEFRPPLSRIEIVHMIKKEP